MNYTETTRDNFFSKIKNNSTLNINDCWEWNGSHKNCGLPSYNSRSAIVIAYEMFYNTIALDTIYKTCKNQNCVNPYHMIIVGTSEFFWYFVNIKTENECWEWNGSLNHDGYGHIHKSGKRYLAHRIAYMFKYGDIMDNMFICHICDNPKCCNPNHLFQGTPLDNSNDKVSKMRHCYGIHVNTNKLNEQQVYEIRYMNLHIPNIHLAKQYNVSAGTVDQIRQGKTWKYI